MNKRIEEFAIECASHLYWDFPAPPNEYTFSPAALEKFAQLIIRECANYAFSDDQDNKAMLKHFGVE